MKEKGESRKRKKGTLVQTPPEAGGLVPFTDGPSPDEILPTKNFPIVGIGASAGGLTAFESFFSAMPFVTEKGIAFVLVQHLAPDHKSILTELVKRYTRMQVFEVEDGMEVKPNCVYIIPPNRDLALLGGKLQLLEPSHPHGVRLTIDYFFRSLAADQRQRSVCIVLSGTGSDGSLGLRAIKAEGGMVMAQRPSTTEFDGMPRSAIATGLVDYILPPAEMPAQLLAYVSRTHSGFARMVQPIPLVSPEIIAKVCVLLRANTRHDFSQYKETTLVRRLERRMAMHQIDHAEEYLRFLQGSQEEADNLFRDLLIGVTSFFRDEAFRTVEHEVIPKLFDSVAPGAIRIWVCGCSTGEEAYSIAILLREYLEQMNSSIKLQIFATDIDRRATDQARAGIFDPTIAADVSPGRLARHFTRDTQGFYRINKNIRDLITFSEQDVLQDPPFSKLNFISCRNLLIYLNMPLQRRLIPLFHYALNPGGFLFLGSSETIGDYSALFDTLDRKSKIYVRRHEAVGTRRISITELVSSPASGSPSQPAPFQSIETAHLDFRQLCEQALLRHSNDVGVLITGSGEILYFYGRTGKYLEAPPGNASSNIFTMAREGIRRELSFALQNAVVRKESVRVESLHLEAGERPPLVDLTILPIANSRLATSILFFVLLQERRPLEAVLQSAETDGPIAPEITSRIAILEHELRTKDEYIHSLVEEMATSSEELKSSNEELQSVNEEMQSTNEELETSKEELQSLNEELATVNAELNDRVASLLRATSDMDNLMAGTGVGTLFIDHQLRISRFTPNVVEIINLIPSDVGRPLAHTVTNLRNYDRLVNDVKEVINTLQAIEVEAELSDGRWYLLGIRPYRRLDGIVEGAVVTFLEITERKVIESHLHTGKSINAMEIQNPAIVFFNVDGGGITFANDAFLRLSGYDRDDLANGTLTISAFLPTGELPKLLEEMKGNTEVQKRELIRKDGSRRWVFFSGNMTNREEAVEFIVEGIH